MVILSYLLLWHKASGLWAQTGCFSSDIICIKQKEHQGGFVASGLQLNYLCLYQIKLVLWHLSHHGIYFGLRM